MDTNASEKTSEQGCTRSGWTDASTPFAAAEALRNQLFQADLSLVVLFCSANYDLDTLAKALRGQFGTATVIGCTTSGELGPNGYTDNSISGISFAAPEFHTVVQTLNNLESFEFSQGHDIVNQALTDMSLKAPEIQTSQMFSMIMIDGMCMREEVIVSALHANLGQIPLFGGSAGDNLMFENTHVLIDGNFRRDVGVLALIGTTCPFQVFKTEHFVGSDKKMVVTKADPLQRIVYEINAEPASEEYANQVGLARDNLSPMQFASHPVVVRVGGEYFVRSIQKVNADGSLSFFCAIDEGIVLTVAEGIDFAENLKQQLQQLRDDIGELQLVVGCDCVFRKLEIEQTQAKEQIGKILADNKVVGFSTYGEQFNAMHVNQTLTGVAIGRAPNNGGEH